MPSSLFDGVSIFGTDYGFMAKMLATPLLDFKLILRRKSKQVLEKPQQPSNLNISLNKTLYNQYNQIQTEQIYRNTFENTFCEPKKSNIGITVLTISP